MTRRKLPIGMQIFRKIREGRCYYVDKTAYIRQLLDEGEHYFLSRPRRFGKGCGSSSSAAQGASASGTARAT